MPLLSTIRRIAPTDRLRLAPRLTSGQLLAKRLSAHAVNWLRIRVPALQNLPPAMVQLAMNPSGASGEAAGIVGDKYEVESGDWPAKIAEKLTGSAARWKELVAANPQKKRASDGNFATLYAGELLNVPAAWWPLIATRIPGVTPPGGGATPTTPTTPTVPTVPGLPAPGGDLSTPWGNISVPGLPSGWGEPTTPTTPQIPGGTPTPPGGTPGGATPTYPAGLVLQSQMMLAAWVKEHQTPVTPAYGQPTDFTGAPDLRYSHALSAFQKWANLYMGAGLVTDGRLDQPTYNAQTSWFAAATKNPPGTPGGTVPGLPGGSTPGVPGGTVPGLPGGSTPPGGGEADNKSGGALLAMGLGALMFLR